MYYKRTNTHNDNRILVIQMKKANIWNSVAYYKPAIKKLVIRAGGVNRSEEGQAAVSKQNAVMAEVKPASKCKGQSWGPFVACMRRELNAVAKKASY